MVDYKWIILLTNILANISTLPGHSFGINMFVEEWMVEFQISRMTISLIWLGTCTISGLYVTRFGKIVDSYGTRKTSFIMYPLYIAALYTMYFVYNKYIFALILCLIRILGPETITTINYVSYTKWFNKLGTIFSLLSIVESLLLLTPLFVQFLIATYGWRSGFLYLTILLHVLLIPNYICIRDKEEDISVETHVDDEESSNSSIPYKEVIKSPTFWSMVVSGSLFNIMNLGLSLNMIHFVRLHYSNTNTHIIINYIYISITLGVLISSISIGYIYDKYSIEKNINILCILELFFAINGIVLLLSPSILMLTYFIYGLCAGSIAISYDILYPKIFGKQDIGSIVTLHDGIVLISGGIGPFLFSLCALYTYNYTLIIVSICILKMAFSLYLCINARKTLRR